MKTATIIFAWFATAECYADLYRLKAKTPPPGDYEIATLVEATRDEHVFFNKLRVPEHCAADDGAGFPANTVTGVLSFARRVVDGLKNAFVTTVIGYAKCLIKSFVGRASRLLYEVSDGLTSNRVSRREIDVVGFEEDRDLCAISFLLLAGGARAADVASIYHSVIYLQTVLRYNPDSIDTSPLYENLQLEYDAYAIDCENDQVFPGYRDSITAVDVHGEENKKQQRIETIKTEMSKIKEKMTAFSRAFCSTTAGRRPLVNKHILTAQIVGDYPGNFVNYVFQKPTFPVDILITYGSSQKSNQEIIKSWNTSKTWDTPEYGYEMYTERIQEPEPAERRGFYSRYSRGFGYTLATLKDMVIDVNNYSANVAPYYCIALETMQVACVKEGIKMMRYMKNALPTLRFIEEVAAARSALWAFKYVFDDVFRRTSQASCGGLDNDDVKNRFDGAVRVVLYYLAMKYQEQNETKLTYAIMRHSFAASTVHTFLEQVTGTYRTYEPDSLHAKEYLFVNPLLNMFRLRDFTRSYFDQTLFHV